MNEPFDAQVSEFIDDELSAEECEFFVRRLQRDDAARDRYLRYQFIGAAVRGEHRQHNHRTQHNPRNAAGQLPRPRTALAGTMAYATSPPRWLTGTRLAAAAGIAASLALVAVIGFSLAGLGFQFPRSGERAPSVAAATGAFPNADITVDARQFAGQQADMIGMQYLIHHTGVSSGLSRTILHSSVVSGQAADPAIQPEVAGIE